MATRASNRSTKAVKFLQSAESDENADSSKSMRVKIEEKKTRGRPSNTRRNRRDDDNDEEWDETNEANDDDDDDDDEEEDAISPEDEGSDNEQDATKKFKANRSLNSVYDFGDASRKWVKSTPQRSSSTVPKTPVSDSGKGTEKLMCSYCNYTTTKKYLLQRHLKSHSTERPHKCAYCDRAFKTTIQLTNHVNTHLGIKPFQCKFCAFSFTTSGELIRHVRYKHTLEKPHRCDECGYATVELSKLRRHIRTHTGEKPYACPHCSYCSPDTFKLKRHLRVHTGERPYQCTICNFRFTQSNSLKAHMLTHQAEKPSFSCSYCPSVMARKSDLRYHIGKQHSRQMDPLPCNKCDEDFPDKYSLRMHGKTHKGQTIHSCTDCEFSATTSQQLDDHMNIHRGKRPFQCSECGLMFAARADLRAHVTRTHKNAASSSVVNRPQRRAASLQHRYIDMSSAPEHDEHGEDDYRCSICHRQFTSARLLDRHTFAVHEPKQASYDDRDYPANEFHPNDDDNDEDDVRDYADDELEEKEKQPLMLEGVHEQLEAGIDESIVEKDDDYNEEEDLAPIVEDIVDGDEDMEQLPTIKSISSGNKKQRGTMRKLVEEQNLSNKRRYNMRRTTFKSNDDEKPDFDVFGFNE